MSAIDAIQSCEYLYLDGISEPQINELRIVILEAKTGDVITDAALAAEPDETLRSILKGSRIIDHFKGCRKFELLWTSYISYSVVNESYSNGEPKPANTKVRLFAEYERSNYLEYLLKATFATEEYPGPYRHWAILCQNHTIDIASQVHPIARELNAGQG